MASVSAAFDGGNLQVVDNFVLNYGMYVIFYSHKSRTIIIQYVWNCLDDLSFMLINTMISMPVPGIVQIVQVVLLNFIYLDILLTDLWIP